MADLPPFTKARPEAVTDTECYPNYWSIAFREIGGAGRVRHFSRTASKPLDRDGVLKILRHWRIFSFNGINYDAPMIALALSGATNGKLKEANDAIIVGGLRYWEFEQQYGVRLPSWVDHIDLMEVSPGSPTKPSLKQYAGRMHSRRMQELPYDPSQPLTAEQIGVLDDYHINDLDVTVDLVKELKSQIQLRAVMSEKYGVDLRSKSDAQVAEAVIRIEIERRRGERVYKPDVRGGSFFFRAPQYIQFKTQPLRDLLGTVVNSPFIVGAGGNLYPPTTLEGGVHVDIGQSRYKVGIGGLHSQEKRAALYSDEDYVILDRDVTSYYPSVILGQRLFPEHLGEDFLRVYEGSFNRRLMLKDQALALEEEIEALKALGQDASGLRDKLRKLQDEIEGLKIELNGSFGKFGSPYSVLYSPNLLIQTTMTGQLAALMLIERLEGEGMRVISANTDGVVTRVPRLMRDRFEHIIKTWEQLTGFRTEETEYRALHARDVNNYIAITSKGKVKTKGAFGDSGPGLKAAAGLKKNPDCQVVNDACVAFLKDGVPVEHTIKSCTDIRKFVTVRRVKGGAEKDGKFLGKVVRWYMGLDRGAITYRSNGNVVPASDGATPCMQLPDEFPLDVDYAWYIREAYAALYELGLDVDDPSMRGRRGWIYGRLPDQKTWHVVTLPSGQAKCGRRPESMRDPWVESRTVPEGQSLCKACRTAHATG